MEENKSENEIFNFLIKLQDDKFNSIYDALEKIEEKLNHFHKRIHDISNNASGIDKSLEITANNVIHFGEKLNKIEEDYIDLKEKLINVNALERMRHDRMTFVLDLLAKWRVWAVLITLALAIDFSNLIKLIKGFF